jgi:WD40 repeat protein
VSRKEIRRVVLSRAYAQVQFLPDGKSLLALTEDSEVHVLDASSGKELVPARSTPIFALSADGKQQATVEKGRLIVQPLLGGKRSLDVPAPRIDPDVEEAGPAGIVASYYLLAFSKDGKTLAVASRYDVQLWDLVTGNAIAPSDSMGGPVLAVHTHGHHLVARNINLGLTLWDMRTGKLQHRFSAEPVKGGDGNRQDKLREIFGALMWYGSLQAISPDGTKLFAVPPDGPIQMWDLASGKPLRRFERSEQAACLALSPNGKLLAAQGPGGDIHVWDTATGRTLQYLRWPATNDKPRDPERGRERELMLLALRFSPDCKVLAVAAMSEGNRIPEWKVVFWELASGSIRRQLSSEKTLSGGRDREIQFLLEIFENMSLSLAYLPDGKHVAATGLRSIRLLEIATGKEVRQFGGRSVAGQSAVFSPDGKLLAAGLETGSVRLWDVASGAILRDIPGHDGIVTALSFAKDGKTLATSSADGTVILWDVDKMLRAAPSANIEAAPELERLWLDLVQLDGAKAESAMKALAARPRETLALLKQRLKPVAPVDPKVLKKLLADLDSERFVIRQSATKELERLGELARVSLEQTLAAKPALETRQRVEVLLKKLGPPIKDGDLLRQIRAVEILEKIASMEARLVLEALAAGAAGHRVTEDAREAVARMKNPRK